MLYRVHQAWMGFELATLVVIGNDCIGSYKSYYQIVSIEFTINEGVDDFNALQNLRCTLSTISQFSNPQK